MSKTIYSPLTKRLRRVLIATGQLNESDTTLATGALSYLLFGLKRLGILKTPKAAFISAMSRSGLWYNREFFYFYNQLMIGRNVDEIFNEMVSEKKRISPQLSVEHRNLGFDAFFIAHWLCPGFESYSGVYKKEIDELVFYSSHYAYPHEMMAALRRRYNIGFDWHPWRNPDARFVYFFRNPLDQNVAFYTAILKTRESQNVRYRKTPEGNIVPFENISDFLGNAGIDMYIKNYLPYKLMAEKFPNNFLLLTYEQLVREPRATFTHVLKYLGHELNTDERKTSFELAIKMSSKESIQKLENAYGHSISFAFESPDARHLHDALIGKWKKVLKDKDLQLIEGRFKEFGMTLDQFILE